MSVENFSKPRSKTMDAAKYIVMSKNLEGVAKDNYIAIGKQAIDHMIDTSSLIDKQLILNGVDCSSILLLYRFTYNFHGQLVNIDLCDEYNALDPAQGVQLIKEMETNPKKFIMYEDIIEDAIASVDNVKEFDEDDDDDDDES